MTRKIEGSALIVLCVVVIYVVTASVVFQFRHPWATSTERFLHTIDALKFAKVTYSEMRDMEPK